MRPGSKRRASLHFCVASVRPAWRTWASSLTSSKRSLKHISGHKAGAAGTYNRSTYAKEKRAAMDTWATHLQTLLAGATNVRRLARKAG